MYAYSAFGFTVQSELRCPELLPVESLDNAIDVKINMGEVPQTLRNPDATGARYSCNQTEFLLHVDGIASYHVSDGRKITIQPKAKPESRDIRLFLLGSAFGALIHQRQLFPLHACSVKIGNNSILLCGESGAGKSTTGRALWKNGYDLQADDICVVSTKNKHEPVVYPGYPQFKLWVDAMERASENIDDYEKVRHQIEKYAVPVANRFCQEALPLRTIYCIQKKHTEEIEMELVSGMKCFNLFKNNTYRPAFIASSELKRRHFEQISLLSQTVPVKIINRPQNSDTVEGIVQLILEDCQQDA